MAYGTKIARARIHSGVWAWRWKWRMDLEMMVKDVGLKSSVDTKLSATDTL